MKKSVSLDEARHSRIIRSIEELYAQYNDLVQMFMAVHGKYVIMMVPEEKLEDEAWFDEVDERLFSFKHKVINCLSDLKKNDDNKSQSSGRSKSTYRNKSTRCSSRSSIKEMLLQGCQPK